MIDTCAVMSDCSARLPHSCAEEDDSWAHVVDFGADMSETRARMIDS
jgi:hypothetical protein